MGEEQRAAQRIDLADPVQARVGDVAAKIVDISLVGCRIEHADKLTMGTNLPLYFEWRGEPVQLTVKIARTELRSAAGKMTFSTGLQFASSVDTSPEAVRRIMASLVKTSVAEVPPAELPIFFERAPFFRDEEPDAPPPPKPAPPPVAAAAIALPEQYDDGAGPSYELDFNPAATATHIDAYVEPVIATQSFELESDEIATAVEEHHDHAGGQSFELESETQEQYAQCTFEDGKWKVTRTTEPKQPRDGFTIVDPGDQREIDQFCRTYEYADPDTRRMIRVSCELMIAQPRGR